MLAKRQFCNWWKLLSWTTISFIPRLDGDRGSLQSTQIGWKWKPICYWKQVNSILTIHTHTYMTIGFDLMNKVFCLINGSSNSITCKLQTYKPWFQIYQPWFLNAAFHNISLIPNIEKIPRNIHKLQTKKIIPRHLPLHVMMKKTPFDPILL